MVHSTALPFSHAVPEEEGEESVAKMIGKYFHFGGNLPDPGRRGSVESCEENIIPSTALESSLEDDLQLLRGDLTRQMEICLTEAKSSVLLCQALLLPRHMTGKVANDVLTSSADEPCGLRGATINLYVDRVDGLTAVGSICPDPDVTPTFELSVIFRAEEDGWPPLRRFFDGGKVLKLRPEYRLVKRKLYSSASPVIHDFS